jgi:hypothetical protein
MTSLVVLTLVMVGIIWIALELVVPTSSIGQRFARLVRDAAVHRRARHRRQRGNDPFEVLRVQTRLAAVAGQIRTIEANRRLFARRHRLAAAQNAYDDLLVEACELAGVDVPGKHGRHHDAAERWREERELTERGWSW